MSHSERFQHAKESFMEKSNARKGNTEIMIDVKPVKPPVKKPISSENKPPITTLKPVLKRLEAQHKLNDGSKSLGEEEKESSQDAPQPRAPMSDIDSSARPSELSKTSKIEPTEKNISRQVGTPSTSATPLSKTSESLKTSKKELPEPKRRTSQELSSGSSMILERIQKLKSAQEVKPSQSDKRSDKIESQQGTSPKNEILQSPPKPRKEAAQEVKRSQSEKRSDKIESQQGTNPKIEILQSHPKPRKEAAQEKFYRLLTLPGVSGKAPRKPARPPSVNLDSLDRGDLKDLPAVQTRQLQVKEDGRSSTRPISILTEEQEMEEALKLSQGNKRTHQNSTSDEELYQELD